MPSSFPKTLRVFGNELMNIQHTHQSAVTQAIYMVAVLGVAIVSLLAAVVYPYPYRKLGHYIVTTNSEGLGIYQPGTHSNYTISPFADYAGGPSGESIPLSARTQRTTVSSVVDTLMNRWNSVLHYFNMGKFTHLTDTVSYAGDIAGDTLTVKRTLALTPNVSGAKTLVTVFPYNRDDLVIDELGTLFTENTDAALRLAEKTFNIRLTRDDLAKRIAQATGNSVSIVNPHVPGVLIVTIPVGNAVAIDKDTKRILIYSLIPTGNANSVVTQFAVSEADSPYVRTGI